VGVYCTSDLGRELCARHYPILQN